MADETVAVTDPSIYRVDVVLSQGDAFKTLTTYVTADEAAKLVQGGFAGVIQTVDGRTIHLVSNVVMISTKLANIEGTVDKLVTKIENDLGDALLKLID